MFEVRRQAKTFLAKIDRKCLNSRITDFRSIHFAIRRFLEKKVKANSFIINYVSQENELNRLCHKYGTDKGQAVETLGEHALNRVVHNYADFYHFLFSNKRQNISRVFECGIGTNNEALVSSMGKDGIPGASLRVWREYFPNALIMGADIDEECIFEESRISTYLVDQTDSESIRRMWAKIGNEKYDLMIDDGLHTLVGGKILFENSISLLAEDGFYIIEDVNPWDMREFEVYFSSLPYLVYFVHLPRSGIALGDNSLVVIQKAE